MGYTTILDMTEESILKGNDYVKGNPPYLCIVKKLPHLLFLWPRAGHARRGARCAQLEVQSVLNGQVYAKNTVSNMTHRPARLVSPPQQHSGLVRR